MLEKHSHWKLFLTELETTITYLPRGNTKVRLQKLKSFLESSFLNRENPYFSYISNTIKVLSICINPDIQRKELEILSRLELLFRDAIKKSRQKNFQGLKSYFQLK